MLQTATGQPVSRGDILVEVVHPGLLPMATSKTVLDIDEERKGVVLGENGTPIRNNDGSARIYDPRHFMRISA